MAFCSKDRQQVSDGVTAVDNRFLINYMPDAPDMRSAVYLLGLALADGEGTDNAPESMAKRLGITVEDIMDAYAYWEEMGLVHVINSAPPQVIYLSVRNSAGMLKKIKPSKYARFTREIQNVLSGRMITVNEYNEYYMFLENTTFEPEALIAVAKYCAELKGSDINYPYILTVCRNQLAKGATTLEVVTENLSCQRKYDADLRIVFKALGLTRKIDHGDREMYEKWTKDMGFTLDVIKDVAKRCKKGGTGKLDAAISEYYRKGVFSVKEIDAYESYKSSLYELAREINKAIGVYYQSLDMIVDEYLTEWIRKGYDKQTLLAVARYCFRSGIRTLNGLASVIDKLYKSGVTTVESLEQYLDALASKDRVIKSLLEKSGLSRNVTANDRQLYRIWTENWNTPQELLDWAAAKSAGTVNPTAYMNRILSDCKQRNITTAEQAENDRRTAATEVQGKGAAAGIGGIQIERHSYTDEQLNALFSALDESEED